MGYYISHVKNLGVFVKFRLIQVLCDPTFTIWAAQFTELVLGDLCTMYYSIYMATYLTIHGRLSIVHGTI